MVYLWRRRYFTMMPFQMCVFYQLLEHKSLHQQHHSPLIDPIRIKKNMNSAFRRMINAIHRGNPLKKSGEGKKAIRSFEKLCEAPEPRIDLNLVV